MDDELERILAESYLDDLGAHTVADLRARRSDCQSVETRLSYLRRMVQGRHDIVAAELDHRRSGGDPDDLAGLVDRLPEILADRVRGPGSGRLPGSIDSPMPSGTLVDRLDAIAEAVPLDTPVALDHDALVEAAAQLRVLESEVSALRRVMFGRIDEIESELTDRYASGEASVDDLLTPRPD